MAKTRRRRWHGAPPPPDPVAQELHAAFQESLRQALGDTFIRWMDVNAPKPLALNDVLGGVGEFTAFVLALCVVNGDLRLELEAGDWLESWQALLRRRIPEVVAQLRRDGRPEER